MLWGLMATPNDMGDGDGRFGIDHALHTDYDQTTGMLKTFAGHRGPVTALRFTSDGHFLATGAQDTSVLLWDLTKLADGK